MIKLLIVDDEPLVQIGIKSMLNWADLGIEVCGTAVNGANALQMIEEYSPELVITDIRMPIMNGLELIRTCRETYGKLPLFLVLTSYEEFQLVKEALSYQVVDYLVKLELDATSLKEAIDRALERLKELNATRAASSAGRPLLQVYHDKFFLRLLHNLFDQEEQFRLQAKDLGLDFTDSYYVTAHGEIYDIAGQNMNHEQLMNLYSSTIQMIREILARHLSCHVISLDLKHFAVIFCFQTAKDMDYPLILEAVSNARSMVHNYFNVWFSVGIGTAVDSPLRISSSYQEARMAFLATDADHPVIRSDETTLEQYRNPFNISLFRNDITKAFEEFDTDVLYQTFTDMMNLFATNPLRYLQAVDGACNLLYLTRSLLPEGDETLSEIFSNYPNGCHSIYQSSNVEQVLAWMAVLRDGLCETLKQKKVTYKANVIHSVQKYIQAHIEEKLSLNDIAAVFGLSPNYLSVLFKKTCSIGFSEYISHMKINKAKSMLLEQNMKIYEVAEHLGFESAFYFSKVFKKVEGISPREYIQQKLNE